MGVHDERKLEWDPSWAPRHSWQFNGRWAGVVLICICICVHTNMFSVSVTWLAL